MSRLPCGPSFEARCASAPNIGYLYEYFTPPYPDPYDEGPPYIERNLYSFTHRGSSDQSRGDEPARIIPNIQ
jgi:hypothetical protein